ncbi:hypothetical protein [Pelagicoccus mobilis]|uniref:Uncharacterized protein n=1 Tax=Pelagicoccus mobilis TaxID=415221 RepID=A0A934RXK4_9BACT|nr:hypothetical protein [Pelagicoccus mobilis]MBK1877320.1 hypothetical protein [Pelagicoccus mobilis]
MDRETAKEILSAYRPNGTDALDDNLQAALEQARRDPELNKWFESQIDFDKRQAGALASIKGPEAGKKAILATALFQDEAEPIEQPAKKKIVFVNWWRQAAAAAVVAFAALYSVFLYDRPDPELGELSHASWLHSVSILADSALPLDKRGNQIPAIHQWLDQRGAPHATSLPGSLTHETQLAGCRIFDLPNGKKASLVCFAEGSDFVHVFTVRKSDLQGMPIQEQSWERQGDWNLFAWSEGDMLMTIASKLSPEALTPLLSQA